jgi:hypothetical protein
MPRSRIARSMSIETSRGLIMLDANSASAIFKAKA